MPTNTARDYSTFKGPDPVEEERLRREWHMAQMRADSGSLQGSLRRFVGTPRHAKHRGQHVNGVRIT